MNEENKSHKNRNIAIGSIAVTVLVPIIIAVIENGGIDLFKEFFMDSEEVVSSGSRPTDPPSTGPTDPPSTRPTTVSTPLKEITFLEKNGIKEVCVNLPESTNNIQFHAWRSDGSGIDLPMNSTSESSCMYWTNLPAGAEGGTLKIDGKWASVGDFLVRTEDGCSEIITINEGIIKASTSPNSSLLETRDSINGDPGKWGWACK